MKSPFIPLSLGLLAASMLVGLTGCESPATIAAEPPATKAPIRISRGMNGEQVRELLGEPRETQQGQLYGRPTEIWIYVYPRGENYAMSQTRTVESPRYNAITGEIYYVTEAVSTPELIELTEVIKIVFREGVVVNWTQEREEARNLLD